MINHYRNLRSIALVISFSGLVVIVLGTTEIHYSFKTHEWSFDKYPPSPIHARLMGAIFVAMGIFLTKYAKKLSSINADLRITRSSSEDLQFKGLVTLLDAELRIRDGDQHQFYAQFNQVDSAFYVVMAYVEGQPVGCGAIKKYSQDAAEIKRMFVKFEFRGQGIATVILKELENWAKELEFTECILETGKKQPEAIRLYKKSGYVLIPNYGQYEGVVNSVCMSKTFVLESLS